MSYTSNFVIKELKSRSTISNEQTFENKAFWMGFMHLKIKIQGTLKQKTKLTKTKI